MSKDTSPKPNGKGSTRIPVPAPKEFQPPPPIPTMTDVYEDFERQAGEAPLFSDDIAAMEVEFSGPVGNKSRIEHRRKLRVAEDYLIDPIFPKGTMNLIGGPSGIGKTTWLFQVLHEWSRGLPALGKYKCKPCSFVYVSFDRGVLETDRTLRRLGYGDWDIPIYSIEDLGNEPDLGVIFDRFPTTDLYVVEGLQAALPDGKGNQNRIEMRWAIEMRKKMLNKGKTIIATTHSPKSQVDTAHSRSNFLGSVSLHACFSTMISFDIPSAAREAMRTKAAAGRTPNREVLIQGRDFQDIVLSYSRDEQGRFRMVDGDLEGEVQIDTWLSTLPAGTKITSKELEARVKQAGMSRTVFYRWIQHELDSKALNRIGRGIYFKPY